LRFIVRDYGCGIHPDQLVNVFQPFVQAGDDTHRLYEGTGLGLAITSKLVQALGGCVYANSTLGAGSEFCVEFPYEQDEVDVESVAEQMRNTIVLLIPGQNMPEDNVPVMEKLLTTYQINYRILSSMDDLDHVILQGSQSNSLTDLSQASQSSVSDGSDDSLSHHHDMIFLPKDRAYLCLVDESVYEREVWQRWKEHHSPTVLLTFGPDYTVPETSNHYRNLLQILPSVLVQSLADSMEEAKALKAPKIKGRRRKMTFSRAKKPNAPVREKQDISILVVEDNVINQKVLIALLKKIGYTQVDVVGDGSMAVDAVEHNKYDIVLMDVQMPVMDGLEATKIIGERQQEKFVQGDKTPAPKIVFVTASVDQELEEQAAKLGAVGFVPKPFNLRQLETCMTELCKSLT
jgi:CheY-like chemotaxis protein